MTKKKKTLIILDGNALIHRAWHALPPLTDPQGRVVNAIYGFISVLLKMIKEQEPEYIAVTFDLPGKTFRHEEFEEYKATRVKQPDELYEQIPLAKEMLKVFDIPIFEKAGYEADDVIGTISKILDPKRDVESVIVTGDLDTLQLVDDNTKVLTFVKGLSETKLYDEKEVNKKYGFGPEKLIDFKAIKGDPSDNIPGVPGIGDKGATDLIKKYGSLSEIYKEIVKNPDKFKKSVLEKLKDGKESAKLSQDLVTIVTDLKIKFDLEKCKVGTWNRDKLVNEFGRYGFKSLLAKLPGAEAEEKISKKEFIIIDSLSKMEKLINDLKKEREIAISLEIEDAGLFGDSLAGMGIRTKSGAHFLALGCLKKQDQNKFWKSAGVILEDNNIKKIGYDLKHEMEILANYSIKLQGLDFDVMIASYLLASGTRTHDLGAIILQELGKELVESGKDIELKKINFIWELKKALEPKLKKADVLKLFNEVEMPLIPVLAEMERNGVKVNTSFLKKMATQVDGDLKKITKKIYKLAGEEFNINSPQ
ncbi:MAG: hypothetical protein GWN16_11075, partial [Calditrichae bacterium]|nr:hypothetical protein [Calditrichia bacterium]